LDIRHIAFSSAYVGHAIVGLEFFLPWHVALLAAVGIALIGLTNLTVSFALTLSVALRARRITFEQGQNLLKLVFERFMQQPRDFFLPPPRERHDTPTQATANLEGTMKPPGGATEKHTRAE